MRGLLRLLVVGLILVAAAVVVLHYGFGLFSEEWDEASEWAKGKVARAPELDLSEWSRFLPSLREVKSHIETEARRAREQFQTLKEKAAQVMDDDLRSKAAAAAQAIEEFTQETKAEVATFDSLLARGEQEVADTAARDTIKQRASQVMAERRTRAGAGRAAADRARAEFEHAVRRRLRLYNALDTSEKAVFNGFPDSWSFEEKWQTAVRKQLSLRKMAPHLIEEHIERRRREALGDDHVPL
ncbi:MAG TPA: hypothetical protein VM238_15535 [Phycisphaerae bacterium]|nr:hypothetical protein [Phycisphaerae bacterium]